MSAYEIPSAEIALHFHRLTHDLDFGHGDPLPLCRRCGQGINGDQWARMEECPGRPLEPLSLYAYLLNPYKEKV